MKMNRIKNVVSGATTYGQEQYADEAIRKGWEAVMKYAKDYASQALNIFDFTDAEAREAAFEIINTRADMKKTAEPTSRCLSGSNDYWAAEEWKQDGLIGHDLRVSVYYLFSAEEIVNEDGQALEADCYPWDAEHVSKIEV
jgi:hypothetical protein